MSLLPLIDYATDDAQRIAAYIREASLSKPETENLRSSGVEIRVGDVTDGIDKLKRDLEGVDVVISALVGPLVGQQRDLALAAKRILWGRFSNAGQVRAVRCPLSHTVVCFGHG